MLSIFYVQSSILSNLEYINRHCYRLLGVQNPGKITDHLNLIHPSRWDLKLFLGFSICFTFLA